MVIVRWLSSLWARLRWRRAVAPPRLPPGGRVLVDLRLVVHRDDAGRISYLLRDPDGQPADTTALTSLFTAVADLGMSIPGLAPPVRKACKKLDLAMGALRSRARAQVAAATAGANGKAAASEGAVS